MLLVMRVLSILPLTFKVRHIQSWDRGGFPPLPPSSYSYYDGDLEGPTC